MPNTLIIFVCHDQNSVDECLKKHSNAYILFVGPNSIKYRDLDLSRIIIVRDLKDNIEYERKLLTFTAWYAIIKNNLFSENKYLCILEWDIDNVPEYINHNESIDILSFYTDNKNKFLDKISTDVLTKFLKVKNFEYTSYNSTWFATTNHSLKREILEKFINWYYPDCIKIIKEEDEKYFSWYHERCFWCFIILNKYKTLLQTGLVHRWNKSHCNTINNIITHKSEKSTHNTINNIITNNDCIYNSINNNTDKFIFITLTNSGYVNYTLNCLESLKKIGISTKLLHSYVIGKEGYELIKQKNYSCTLIDDEINSNFQSYRNGNWSDIIFYKFKIIYENLQIYDYICITDGDIVFENNKFLLYLKDNIKQYDMLIQNDSLSDNDSSNLCSGFMYIKSNKNTKSLFNPTNVIKYKKEKNWGDQIYINEVKTLIKYKLLPLELFPNGQYYYKKPNLSPYMIHFNWTRGHEKKEKMILYNKWYIELFNHEIKYKYKCVRINCIYQKHTNIENNNGFYCCRACRDGGTHGSACEKIENKNKYSNNKQIINKLKIALCFWGITRSLTYTVDSIKEKIFNVLKNNNIEYTIFMHTYRLSEYKNIRTNENIKNIQDIEKINDEYKLLNTDFIQIDNQDEIKNKLNLNSYRTHPDPWNTQYNSVDNFILGMYSKFEVTNMVKDSNTTFDYIIYLRPDVKYIDNFNLDFLKITNDSTICIPDFDLFGPFNFNDRFAICTKKNYQLYGNIFDKLIALSKIMPLHSETLYGKILYENKINVNKINFKFCRIRCDGNICNNDKRLL